MRISILLFIFMWIASAVGDEFSVSNNTTNEFWLKVDFLWRQVPTGESIHFAGSGSTASFWMSQDDLNPLSVYVIRTGIGAGSYDFSPQWVPRFTLDFNGTNYYCTAWQYMSVYQSFSWGFATWSGFVLVAMGIRWAAKMGKSTPSPDID